MKPPHKRSEAHLIDLGVDGGQKLRENFSNRAKVIGKSLGTIVDEAYIKIGRRGKTAQHPVTKPYDTVKKWFARKHPKVRRELFEAILEGLGYQSILDYKDLPPNERDRLTLDIANSNNSEPSTSAFLSGFFSKLEIIDLSREIRSEPTCGFLVNAPNTKMVVKRGETGDTKFITTVINYLPCNYGTHIDFPGHLRDFYDGKQISSFSLENFVSEAVVVDVSDYTISLFAHLDEDDLLMPDAFGEGEKGIRNLFEQILRLEISVGDFTKRLKKSNVKTIKRKAVLFYTGLESHWQYGVKPSWRFAYFLNPFLSQELADYLVSEDVVLIGSDSLQLECPLFNISPDTDFAYNQNVKNILKETLEPYNKRLIHRILLEKTICIVENLCRLKTILDAPVIFVAVPLKFAHPICADNSPTRAFALKLVL